MNKPRNIFTAAPGSQKRWRIVSSLALALLLAFLSIALAGGAAPAQAAPMPQTTPQPTTEYCLGCHSNPDLSMTFPDGEKLSLYVDPNAMAGSVHGPMNLQCEACHTEITTYPHPPMAFQNRRELSRSYYLSCKKCHEQNYEKTQDSMHAQMAQEGKLEAPVCTDCHGYHDVQPPDEPRAKISETCGKCHTEIHDEYVDSVHGAALIGEDNPDVPVCTDCHGVHNISDPRTDIFRVDIPEMCAQCHSDPELMGKYGLTADVYSLYKTSWHGVDLAVFKAKWPNLWHNSAICVDCHGIHDIRKTDDPDSRVNSTNLLATCQTCHPDAGPNWVGAWTGHEKVSRERTPFVYYTEAFYSTFTPFILWLSAIYVALQIIRSIVDRVRRSLS